MTAAPSNAAARCEAFGDQLEAFAARYPELPRRRENVEAPDELTRAYVDLVISWGLARLGRLDTAERLRSGALARLDAGNPVHGVLAGALGARIDQAIAGAPIESPLPLAITRRMAGLARFERYKVDATRLYVSILEPVEPLAPLVAFQRAHDGLGAELGACRVLDDAALGPALDRITTRALRLATDRAERGPLLVGVLCFAPRLGEDVGTALLERVLRRSDGAGASTDVTLVALTVATYFRRPDLVEQALERIVAPLVSLPTLRAPGAVRALRECLPRLRAFGHRDRVRELLGLTEDRRSADEPPDAALASIAVLAAAHAYLGEPEARSEAWWTAEHPGIAGVVSWARVGAEERRRLHVEIEEVLKSGRAAVPGDLRVLGLEVERREALAHARTAVDVVETELDLLGEQFEATPAPPRRPFLHVANALAQAASFLPDKDALDLLERHFLRLRFVSDALNTNSHLCVSVVGYVNALVRANVARALDDASPAA